MFWRRVPGVSPSSIFCTPLTYLRRSAWLMDFPASRPDCTAGTSNSAGAVLEAPRRVQRRLPCVEERLEPAEGVLVLQRGIPGADDAQHLGVRRAPHGPVSDLGLGVGGDERDQFHVPIQARLPAGAGPI